MLWITLTNGGLSKWKWDKNWKVWSINVQNYEIDVNTNNWHYQNGAQIMINQDWCLKKYTFYVEDEQMQIEKYIANKTKS